jgi:deoxyribonucleoside regulator
MAKRRFLEQIARMYYILDLNQQQIAEQLGIGRSSVARFLNEAREMGVVHFQIDSDPDSHRCRLLERELLNKTSLKDCVVFQSENGAGDSFDALVSQYLNSVLPLTGTIGLGWGKTLYAVGSQMHLCDPRPHLKVLQLSGGSGTKEEYVPATSVVQLWTQALRAKPCYLPAPAVASTAESRRRFLEDPSIRAVMEELKQVMVAIVGIGHTGEDASILTSQLIPGLTSETLSACSVGDVILHFYDEQGRFSFDALSERVIGASREDFLRIHLRIGIAYGKNKIRAIAGALKGDLVHILITTEATAQALVRAM